MSSIPFWSGKNVKLALFLGDDTLNLFVKSCSVKENATLIQDDVNGEDRSRTDKIVNFYEISIETFQFDTKLLKALAKDSQFRDNNVGRQEGGLGFLVFPNNGTKAAFEAQEVTIDDWSWDVPARTDRSMVTIPARARYFKEVA